MAWNIVCKDEIRRFEANFPALGAPALPDYVVLTDGRNKSEVLRTSKRRGATGDEIWVAKSSRLQNGAVTYQEASKDKYLRYVLWHDTDSILAVIGFSIALIGVYVDASLAVGKYVTVWTFSDKVLGWFAAISGIIKVPGLLLAAYGTYKKQVF